ncbi:hypothetical protein [Turicibacter sp.]|uniref:hypothetical protein n=1 Tax=Turicibacter sp. TaxID=2049042 RepID=UPI001B53CE02|nr:hypothetical protein [Turicibacter sp.]MBP3905049.1 hypothetical protein [Turicibacter sp.]
MELLKVEKITKKEIAYINELSRQGKSLRSIIRSELKEGASNKTVKADCEALMLKIKKARYVFNEETKQYEYQKVIKNESSEEIQKSDAENSVEVQWEIDSNSNEKMDEKEEEVQTNQPVKNDENKSNKRGSYKTINKSKNPLMIREKLDIVKVVCEQAGTKESRTATGIYMMSKISEEIKEVNDELYYLPLYALIDAALILSNNNKEQLEKSNVYSEFAELVREQKSAEVVERKKQTNLKLCSDAVKAINELSRHFAFLNKSEIINLCLYALAKSCKEAQIVTEKNEN